MKSTKNQIKMNFYFDFSSPGNVLLRVEVTAGLQTHIDSSAEPVVAGSNVVSYSSPQYFHVVADIEIGIEDLWRREVNGILTSQDKKKQPKTYSSKKYLTLVTLVTMLIVYDSCLFVVY